MLRGFEPAFAGGLLSRNSALAQAYRVISIEMGALTESVGSKRRATSRTQQGSISYTIFDGAMVVKN